MITADVTMRYQTHSSALNAGPENPQDTSTITRPAAGVLWKSHTAPQATTQFYHMKLNFLRSQHIKAIEKTLNINH